MANKFGQIFRQAPNPQYQRLDLGLYRDALAQTRARYDVTQNTLSTLDRGMSQIDVGDNEQAKQLLAERTGIIHQGIDKLLAQGNLEDLTLQSQQLANQFLRDEDVKTLLRSKQEYDAQRQYALQHPGQVIDFNRYQDHQFIGVDEKGNRVINQYVADNENKLDWATRKVDLVQAIIDDDTTSGWATDEEKGAMIKIIKGQATGLTKSEEKAVLEKMADFYVSSTEEGRQQIRALTTANSLNQFDPEAALSREQAIEKIQNEFYNLEGAVRDRKVVTTHTYEKNPNAGAGGMAGLLESPYYRNIVRNLEADGKANMSKETFDAVFGDKVDSRQLVTSFGANTSYEDAVKYNTASELSSIADAYGATVEEFLRVFGPKGENGTVDLAGYRDPETGELISQPTTVDIEWGPGGFQQAEGSTSQNSLLNKVPQQVVERFMTLMQQVNPDMDVQGYNNIVASMAEMNNNALNDKFGTFISNLGPGKFTPEVSGDGNMRLVNTDEVNVGRGEAVIKGSYEITDAQLQQFLDQEGVDADDLMKAGLITPASETANNVTWAVTAYMPTNYREGEKLELYDQKMQGNSELANQSRNLYSQQIERENAIYNLRDVGKVNLSNLANNYWNKKAQENGVKQESSIKVTDDNIQQAFNIDDQVVNNVADVVATTYKMDNLKARNLVRDVADDVFNQALLMAGAGELRTLQDYEDFRREFAGQLLKQVQAQLANKK